MKPIEKKGIKIDGGIFITNEGLEINIPPKNIIEKEVLRKELLKMQENYLMEIDVGSNYIYKDEKGKTIKRTTLDGKTLTSAENEKEDRNSEIGR